MKALTAVALSVRRETYETKHLRHCSFCNAEPLKKGIRVAPTREAELTWQTRTGQQVEFVIICHPCARRISRAVGQ